MEGAGSSEDCPAVGAEAGAPGSVMVGWSGRVKEGSPDRKWPSREHRKSFDDDHGSGTFWTAETSGLGRGGSGGCGGGRHGIGGGQEREEGEERGGPATGAEAERGGAGTTARQEGGEETAETL